MAPKCDILECIPLLNGLFSGVIIEYSERGSQGLSNSTKLASQIKILFRLHIYSLWQKRAGGYLFVARTSSSLGWCLTPRGGKKRDTRTTTRCSDPSPALPLDIPGEMGDVRGGIWDDWQFWHFPSCGRTRDDSLTTFQRYFNRAAPRLTTPAPACIYYSRTYADNRSGHSFSMK
jgi:hypothetical protein